MTTPLQAIACSILADGVPIPDACQVCALSINQTINRIATAQITLLDGASGSPSFSISSSSVFVPGTMITVSAGDEGASTVLFEGIVTKQTVRASSATGPLLEVECKDAAIKMTAGRKSASFAQCTDNEVIQKLIGSVSELRANVTPTPNLLAQLVQYYVSDWDFMLMRAEVNGLVVSTVNNSVTVFDPTAETTSVLTLAYGSNLLEFSAELNAVHQLGQVTASAWDAAEQRLSQAQAQNSWAGPGNLSSKALAEIMGQADYAVQTSAAETDADLAVWAKAQMLKSAMSKIVGHARFQGSSAVLPGRYVTLSGLGERFDGDHFVSSVRHQIANGNWTTEVDLGMSPIWFVQKHQIEAPPASGLLPGISGMFNATVKQVCKDPDNSYRVLVDVALIGHAGAGLWARLSNFYASNGCGAFFLPEVGDEVVLGFLNQDPRFPVILGSLYSQKNKPFAAFSPDQTNPLKGIVSKSGLSMTFDDENRILTLVTPMQNTVVLDDQKQQIELRDPNGNAIVMSKSGISIKSPENISLEADGKVCIKGSAGVVIESSAGDVSTSGVNIEERAQMAYSARGNATACVQGGVELTLKAAMVMIN